VPRKRKNFKKGFFKECRVMKAIQKISFLFLWALSSPILAQVHDQEVALFGQLTDQAKILNSLIYRYQADHDLSQADQALYVQNLFDFQIELQDAHDLGLDIKRWEDQYLDPYHQWTQFLVPDQEYRQELEDIHQKRVSQKHSLADTQRNQKFAEVLQDMCDHLVEYQNNFNAVIQQALPTDGTYSHSRQQQFIKTLENAHKSFAGSVKAERMASASEYVMYLQEHDANFALMHLSEYDTQALKSIEEVADNALLAIQACIIDLTSQSVKAYMIDQLKEAFAMSDAAMVAAYQRQIAENQKALDRAWWEDLKVAGKDLMVQFGVEFAKELSKQTKGIIIKVVGGAISDAVVYVKDGISNIFGKKIEALSDTLPDETAAQFIKSLDAASAKLKDAIRATNPEVPPSLPVKISTDTALCQQEKNFVTHRRKRIKKELASLGIKHPLTVAFCCSGGGVRAMIGTSGIMTAAAKTGILQATMYMVGLSGSTWMIAPWAYSYLTGVQPRSILQSLQDLRENWNEALNDPEMVQVSENIFIPASLKGQPAVEFSYQLAQRVSYDEPISVVDWYAARVSNFALNVVGEHRLQVRWSTLANKMEQAEIPLPLCSAVFDTGSVSAARTQVSKQYEWFETSPFRAGGSTIGYAPIQHVGSVFSKGVLQTQNGQLRPEYPLSFWLGVYGSAFSLSPEDIIDKGLDNPTFKVAGRNVTVPIDQWMKEILDEAAHPDARAKRVQGMYARVFNFSYGVPTSALMNKIMIALVDGGLNFNFPLPLLFDTPERGVDVVFIYDSNAGDVNSFRDAAKYFERKGIAVPNMTGLGKTRLLDKKLLVLNDPRSKKYDKSKPTFIYIPTRPIEAKNLDSSGASVAATLSGCNTSEPPCTTRNFKYNPAQIALLADATEQEFMSHIDEIKEVLQKVAEKRHGTESLDKWK
jgi:hypothetical protein